MCSTESTSDAISYHKGLGKSRSGTGQRYIDLEVGTTVFDYIHTEIYTLESCEVNFRSQTNVNQSNVAYRFSQSMTFCRGSWVVGNSRGCG